ncbi:hypothetical protein EON65_05880 [archaeon]|nr:MAG: hypothetical protein EON65_05880 [archaeon]
MLDNCFRLCDECDKVFHKSVIKRSHIRIPVVLAKPCYLIKKHTSSFLPLEQDIVDAVLPIYKPFMEHVRTLYYRSIDITESGLADRRKLFLKRREVLGSYVTSSVRSIIDDRKFKGVPLSPTLSKLLAVLGLQLLQDPHSIENMKEDIIQDTDGKSFQISYWSDMLDNPEFHISTQDYMSKLHDLSPVAPPEITLHCSRRVILSTVIQCLGRFLISRLTVDDTHDPFLSTDHSGGGVSFDVEVSHPFCTKAALDYFAEQGLDAFLVHCAVDCSSRTLLTNADRQYIWWLLRESILTASVLPDTSFVVSKLLGWYSWVLRSDAVIFLDNRGRGSGSGSMGAEYPIETKRQPLLKSAGRKPGATASVLVRTPSGPPRITLTSRLFVLQELRLLMSKTTAFHVANWLRNDISKLSLVQLPVQTPLLSTPSFSRGNSFDSAAKEHEDWGHNGPQSDRSRSKGLTGTCYTCLSGNTTIKDKLVQMGFVTALFDIVCNEKILDMLGLPLISGLDYNNPNGRSIAANILEEISDLEKEVWWTAYASLAHFCAGYEPAKVALDDRNALQVLINVTMKLINETVSLGKLSCINMDYERTLSTVMAELCVTQGQLLCPSKPFRQASLKFPKSVKPTEQSTSRKLPSQTPVSVKPSLQLFMRQLPASLELDLKFNQVSCVSLSSTYYVHEFAMIFSWATLRPGAIRFPEHRVSILSSMGSVRSPGSLQRGAESFGKIPTDSPVVNLDADAKPDMEIASNKLGVRRMSRKIISSASVQSMDNDNKWELESVGRQSSVYGDQTSRGSFNSHQSVTAVLQAFKNMPIAAFLNNDTLDGSGHSRTIKVPTDVPARTDTRQLPTAKLQSRLVPMVYCDALSQMSLAGGLDSYKAIVMYHHILLIKSGLSSWLMDDSNIEDHAVLESPFFKNSKDIKSLDSFAGGDFSSSAKSLKNSDGYYAILRKHMAIYLPHNTVDIAQIEQLNWVPNYSNLEIRNERCFELLLSSMLSSADIARSMLVSVLCGLIESNPVNALHLSSSRSMAAVLAKIFPFLPDQAQDLLGAVISSVAAYSANVSFVRSLLDVVDDNSTASNSALRSKILFIFGKAVDQQVPSKFVQFHGGNVLDCGIILPEIVHPGAVSSSADKGITLSTWIKLEHLSQSSTSLMSKVSFGEQHQLCLYLRTVRTSNTRSLSGSGLDMPQLNRIDNWRKSLQLCWCFDNSIETGFDEQCRLAMANYLLDLADDAGTNQKFSSKKDKEFVETFAKLVGLLGSLAFPHGWVDLPVADDDKKWHSLCLAITESGAKCYFDASSLPVHYFTPLGYVEACQSSTEADVYQQIPLVLSLHQQFLKPMLQCVSLKTFKDSGVKAVLGGLKGDATFQRLASLLADQAVSPDLKVSAREHLQAVEAMAGGFLGSVFGMVVYEGTPSEQDAQAYHHEGICLKTGPKLGKLRSLVGFTSAELDVYQNIMSSQQSLLQKQSVLRSSQASDDVRIAFHGLKVCNHATATEATKLSGVEFDSHAGLQLILPLWQTIHLLGGYKCLYSFMRTDASHAIGLLRVIESIIQSDDEAAIFKRELADKAIAFAIVSNEKMISTEVVQAFFDLVCTGSWIHINGLTTATKIRDWRPELLESYVDLVVSCVHFPDIAKSALDWFRDQCFEYPKLMQTFLKSLSLTPVLIMLSIWSIGNSCSIDVCAKPQLKTVGLVETEKKVAFSNNALSLQLPGKKVSRYWTLQILTVFFVS